MLGVGAGACDLVQGAGRQAALRQMPGCVLFAQSTEHVRDILLYANTAKIPVVTRGSGTGLSGGSLPSLDCIVLCTVRMAAILEVDRANLTMLVEPGVTTLQVAEAATAATLFYPPDPGSMKISTIGGNVWLTTSVPPGSNVSQPLLRGLAASGPRGGAENAKKDVFTGRR